MGRTGPGVFKGREETSQDFNSLALFTQVEWPTLGPGGLQEPPGPGRPRLHRPRGPPRSRALPPLQPAFPLLSPSLFLPRLLLGLPPLELPRPKPTGLQRHPALACRAGGRPALPHGPLRGQIRAQLGPDGGPRARGYSQGVRKHSHTPWPCGPRRGPRRAHARPCLTPQPGNSDVRTHISTLSYSCSHLGPQHALARRPQSGSQAPKAYMRT